MTAIAGCGATPLSVTQLRGSATRICQLAVNQGNRIPAPGSPAASIGFLRAGVPVLTLELRSLRALQPPASLAGNYATATAAFTDQLKLIQETIRHINGGDDPVIAFKLLQTQLAPVEQRGSAAWQALGIPTCINQ